VQAAAHAGSSKGDSRLAAAIEDLFGLEYTARMTAQSGPSKGECRERASRTFVVDLVYPSKEEGAGSAAAAAAGVTPPASPGKSGMGLAAAAVAAGVGAGGNGDQKPRFADLLANSLRAVTETRAWFDDKVGYAWVRQQRVPQKLPKVRLLLGRGGRGGGGGGGSMCVVLAADLVLSLLFTAISPFSAF